MSFPDLGRFRCNKGKFRAPPLPDGRAEKVKAGVATRTSRKAQEIGGNRREKLTNMEESSEPAKERRRVRRVLLKFFFPSHYYSEEEKE